MFIYRLSSSNPCDSPKENVPQCASSVAGTSALNVTAQSFPRGMTVRLYIAQQRSLNMVRKDFSANKIPSKELRMEKGLPSENICFRSCHIFTAEAFEISGSFIGFLGNLNKWQFFDKLRKLSAAGEVGSCTHDKVISVIYNSS